MYLKVCNLSKGLQIYHNILEKFNYLLKNADNNFINFIKKSDLQKTIEESYESELVEAISQLLKS